MAALNSNGTASRPRASRAWWRMLGRLGLIFILAIYFGAFLNRLGSAFERASRPAGFGQGLIQGALMPMALPNLLVGRDVAIYSCNNAGVPYKLGYTAGVNACGAVFFGIMFWRLNRWRKRARTCKPPEQ